MPIWFWFQGNLNDHPQLIFTPIFLLSELISAHVDYEQFNHFSSPVVTLECGFTLIAIIYFFGEIILLLDTAIMTIMPCPYYFFLLHEQ